MATTRKLHFAATSAIIEGSDNAAEVVLCDQKPRQGTTLWATDRREDVTCAKCLAKLDEIEHTAEIIELVHENAEQIVRHIDEHHLKVVLDDRRSQRAFRSGRAYATNGQFYSNDECKALKSFLRKIVVEPRRIDDLVAFLNGFRAARAELDAK